jgi:hypothetical protein
MTAERSTSEKELTLRIGKNFETCKSEQLNEDSKKLRGRLEKDNDDSPHLDRDTRYSLFHVGWFVALGMAAFDGSDRAHEPINFFCRTGCQGRSSLANKELAVW